jgi:hypothetical protein
VSDELRPWPWARTNVAYGDACTNERARSARGKRHLLRPRGQVVSRKPSFGDVLLLVLTANHCASGNGPDCSLTS